MYVQTAGVAVSFLDMICSSVNSNEARDAFFSVLAQPLRARNAAVSAGVECTDSSAPFVVPIDATIGSNAADAECAAPRRIGAR